MERGPAGFFTIDEMEIKPEPALGEGFDRIDLDSDGALEREFERLESTLRAEHAFLNSVAEDLGTHIAAVQSTLDGEIVAEGATFPQDVLDSMDGAGEAIDGAESSFLPDAYQELAPYYQDVSGQTSETPISDE